MATVSLPSESAFSSDQITLSETDRSRLYTCIHTGRTSARVHTPAALVCSFQRSKFTPIQVHVFPTVRC
jgi:hypothetical protein